MAVNLLDRDRGWKALVERIKRAGNAHARVGIIGEKASESHDGVTQVDLAAIHEFGAPKANVPERSFIRRTMDAKREIIGKATEVLAGSVIDGKQPVAKALGKLGELGADEVKKTITEGGGVPPPLKQATIDRKGSEHPLVDSGRLLGAIGYDVEGA